MLSTITKAAAIAAGATAIGVAHWIISPPPALQIAAPDAGALSPVARPADAPGQPAATNAAPQQQPAPAQSTQTQTPPAATATPTPPPTPAPAPAPAPAAGPDVWTEGNVTFISTTKALEFFNAPGSAEWIDARNADEHTVSHIPGSFNIAPGDFAGGNLPAYTNIMDRNKLVLIYCGGGDCDASKIVGVRLAGIGFRNIVIYKDGFKGWTAAGLPVTGSAGGGK